ERSGLPGINEGDRFEFDLEVDRRGKFSAVNLVPVQGCSARDRRPTSGAGPLTGPRLLLKRMPLAATPSLTGWPPFRRLRQRALPQEPSAMSISPLMPVYPRCDVRPVKGEHCHLISEDGTRYLDFAAGIAVNLLGHSHPGLIGAIQQQAATLMHVSNLYGSPQGERLAQRLVDLTFADTVFFTNSGAEAVECA